MIMKWLEPTIERRVREVIEKCESDHQDLTDTFMSELKNVDPKTALVLENIFVERLSCLIETAYREGLNDGLWLFASVQKRNAAACE